MVHKQSEGGLIFRLKYIEMKSENYYLHNLQLQRTLHIMNIIIIIILVQQKCFIQFFSTNWNYLPNFTLFTEINRFPLTQHRIALVFHWLSKFTHFISPTKFVGVDELRKNSKYGGKYGWFWRLFKKCLTVINEFSISSSSTDKEELQPKKMN